MSSKSFVCVLGLLIACGGEEPAPDPTVGPGTAPIETPEATPAVANPEAATPEAAEAPAAVGPEVDLLRALPTEVAASSAYRDRSTELGKLFDDDLETAFNSSTGALVGTWIDVRIPDGATVTGIEMTAGYTYTKPGGEDLFTGNHRVTSVKISRDGEELLTHALDPDNRERQRIPVTGGPGTYRIEIAAVQPGSNADWREACISDLRVLGRAPSAEANSRFPLYRLNELPTRAAPTPPDREGFDEAHRQFLHSFAGAWATHEREVVAVAFIDTGIPFEGEEIVNKRRTRNRLLQRLHDFVAPIDPASGDQLRAALVRSPGGTWEAFEPDLEVVKAALQSVAAWSDEAPVRCRTAQLFAGMRLSRVAVLLAGENMNDEMNSGDPDINTGVDLTDLQYEVEALSSGFSSNPGPTVRRFLAKTLPGADLESLTQNWAEVRSDLQAAKDVCGW